MVQPGEPSGRPTRTLAFVRLLRRVPHGLAWRTRRLTRPVTRPLLRYLKRMRSRSSSARRRGGSDDRSIKNAYPRASARNVHEAIDFVRGVELGRMNSALIERIRNETITGRPLRVALLVNDRTKWNAASLVREMRSEGWEIRLHLCLTDAQDLSLDERRSSYATERAFFAAIDPDLMDLYDPEVDQVVPVEEIDADVVFFQQPWGMKAAPRRLAGRALGAYMHYGFMLTANHGMHYNIGTFHPYLWRYFTQTEAHRTLHLAHDPSAYDRLVVTGYPKLDVYLDADPTERIDHPIWEGPDRRAKRIIFAPHHSLGQDNLRMATFRWTHDVMLKHAQAHPGLQWVYKPHATLRHSVVRNDVMTKEQYAAYEQSWAQLPNATVYDSGDYFEIFRSSDVLITDSGSFLAEYLPTRNPIIWLVQAGSIGLNGVGESLARGFYDVHDLASLDATFRSVVLEGNDPLAHVRDAGAATLVPSGGSAARAVVEHLRRELCDASISDSDEVADASVTGAQCNQT